MIEITHPGVDRMVDLQKRLNKIILETNAAIQRDNTQLWQEFFHSQSNEDWDEMISALEILAEQNDFNLKAYQIANIKSARSALLGGQRRALDRPANKAKAWSLAMSIREICNAIQGVDIPNGPQGPGNKINDLFVSQ
jgi:hypothetical protein